MVSETRTNSKIKHDRRAYQRPRTVEELTERNVDTILQLDEAEEAKLTTSERVVDTITGFCGTLTFAWGHVAWFAIWILANTLPGIPYFDEFPFFLLTTIVCLEAILLSTFILITQNRQSKLSERRNHLDLQINLLAEQENTKMLALLKRIADKVGVEYDDDPDVAILEKSTQPEQLIEQIDRRIEKEKVIAAEKEDGGV